MGVFAKLEGLPAFISHAYIASADLNNQQIQSLKAEKRKYLKSDDIKIKI